MLDAWAASPARFREDANAEEDAALGAYRDRLVVELVQNSVDAAAAASVPARVLLRLSGDLLEAANSGAPLTAVGVEALATLRASAKRDPASVGRFGVGFAAVLAVSDAPVVFSTGFGGVCWSRTETLALAGALPSLADELARRDGAVPVLRLPFACRPDVAGPPDGYDTVVRLPLRDEAARALARRLLAGTDPTLPLTLPGLVELVVEVDGVRRSLICTWEGDDAAFDGRRWSGVARRGTIPAELLAVRPVEERIRAGYEIRALVPHGGWPPAVPMVLRAPQPTDEPLSLPVLLSIPLPLEPNRRHTVPGPLRDWLLDRAAGAVAALAARLDGASTLALVPTGLPAGEVDGRLRDTLATLLVDAPVLPGGRRARECAVLDLGPAADQVTDVVGDALPGLLPGWYAAPRHRPALDLLGVRRLSTADLVEALAGLRRPGRWWAELYAVLAPVPDRDALGALPVPLADGRVVTGPRGLLLPAPDLDVDALVASGLPLRVVDPTACVGGARDVLRGLGAVESTPRGVLGDPAVRAAVADGDASVAPAVLALVRDAGVRPGELPWLADLPLPDSGGDPAPAGELVLPGGPLDRVLAPDAPFGRLDPQVAARWPAPVLAAVGVLRTFGVLRAADVLLDPDEPTLLDLDGSDAWVASLPSDAPPALPELVAVRDLELVDPAAWPQALAELARPPLRAVVLGPSPSYTRWWLRRHALLPVRGGGRLPPPEVLVAGADPLLAGVYDEAEPLPGADEELLRALGCRRGLADVLADREVTLDLLDRLGDADREVPWAAARILYVAAAGTLAGDDVDPPLSVRTPEGVVPRSRAAVVDAPDLLPLLGGWAALRVPLGAADMLARVLGVACASGLAPYEVVSTGTPRSGPGGEPYAKHDPLLVRDADGRPTRAPWRVDVTGMPHVDRTAGPDGLARALAWRSGRWDRRHSLAAALRDPTGGAQRQAEDDLD